MSARASTVYDELPYEDLCDRARHDASDIAEQWRGIDTNDTARRQLDAHWQYTHDALSEDPRYRDLVARELRRLGHGTDGAEETA